MTNIKFKLLLILSVITFQAFAQSNAPSTRFGLGSLNSDVFANTKYYGSLGAGIGNLNQINFANPAAYTNLHAVSFDLGVNFEANNISLTDSLYSTGDGSLSHLAFGLPIKKNKVGLSFGIIPYSNVNYSFLNRNLDPDIGANNELFSGNGSLYQLYLGLGYKKHNFSIGLNAIYMFGQLEYESSIVFPDSTQNLNIRTNERLNMRDITYRLGIQYDIPLTKEKIGEENKEKLFLTLGAAGNTSVNMNTDFSAITESYKIDRIQNTTFLGVRDTINITEKSRRTIKLPMQLSLGATLHNNPKRLIRSYEGIDWLIGLEFDYIAWSQFETPLANDLLDDSWRLSLGARITPELNPRDKNYLKRMDYGLGLYYGVSELVIDNEQFREYGITFGVALPVGYSKTYLSLDVSNRSNGVEDVFSETRFKISASFTLSDIYWFRKTQFD